MEPNLLKAVQDSICIEAGQAFLKLLACEKGCQIIRCTLKKHARILPMARQLAFTVLDKSASSFVIVTISAPRVISFYHSFHKYACCIIFCSSAFVTYVEDRGQSRFAIVASIWVFE
jgi:hypothetical protein